MHAAPASGAIIGAIRWWAELPARAAVVVGPRAALPPRLTRALAVGRRVPPEAAAAGAIGAAALTLALVAGDGNPEFPGPSFEAGLLSQKPASHAAEAPQAPVALAVLSADALAERLVEDPAFGAPPGTDQSARGAAEPPHAPQDAGAEPGAGDSARDAVDVLSAAVPAPAGAILRILERLRTRPSSTLAEATIPPVASVPPSPGQAKAGSKGGGAFAVQLLAAARREQAEQAWDRLKRENADLLGRLQPIIVEPERKVSKLFRLRAGPVAAAGEAQALCASLTRRGVDCIVVHGG